MPKQPTRRSHFKSRRGCLNCKKRHAKCDENRPVCWRCQRLSDTCSWPPGTPSCSNAILASESPSTESSQSVQWTRRPAISNNQPLIDTLASLSHDPDNETVISSLHIDQFDVLDLRLLHHYTAHVYATMDPTALPAQRQIWQTCVVRLGFDQPFLLDGILAISALHLALTSDPVDGLLIRAAAHMDRALGIFRSLVQETSSGAPFRGVESAPSAVFVFACLLVVHSFANANSLGQEDPLDALFTSFRLVRGINTLLQPYFCQILTSEVAALVSNGIQPTDNVCGFDPEDEDVPLKGVCRWLQDEDYHDSNTFPLDDSSNNTPTLHAAQLLKRLTASVHHTKDCSTLGEPGSLLALMFVWPVVISDEFLDRLSRRHPPSLVVLAYFATLFTAGANCWWIAGWDRAIVDAVEADLVKLGHGNDTLLPWLAWPKSVVVGKGAKEN